MRICIKIDGIQWNVYYFVDTVRGDNNYKRTFKQFCVRNITIIRNNKKNLS